jgi:hypothetical protein
MYTLRVSPTKEQDTHVQNHSSAAIHVDLDGAVDIYKGHGWEYPYLEDPIFETGLNNILALFDRNNIRASFFVIASSLDNPRKLELVQEITRRGHEVASHSFTHPNLRTLAGEQKRREIAESREKLEKLLGVKIRGFRAPGYQIDRECIELLSQYEYEYDASAFPTQSFARRLQVPLASMAAPYRPLRGSALLELPLPDHRPSPFPFNPSYSLLFGTRYFSWGLERFRRSGMPLVLLFHLIDAADPMPHDRLNGLKSRVFTLSILSSERKLASCQKMLDLVRRHYQIATTKTLIDEWSAKIPPH